MKETRPSPVDFSALSSPNKSIKRNYGDIRQSPSHFLPNAYFLHRTMSRRVDPATTTVTTTIADPLQNNTKEGSNRYESVLSGSTYQSAITIVDGEDGDSNDNDKEQSSTTTSTPSIDDLLGELQSLTLQSTHGRDKPAVKNQTLNKEVKSIVTFFGCSAVVYFIYKNLIHFQKHSQYLAAKRAALEKIQSPLTKRWDELYAETAIIRPPAVKPLSDEEGELVANIMRKKGSQQLAQLKTALVVYNDIQKLHPGTWLNDEIINFYMELIAVRSQSDENLPNVHCYSTFFCSTLRDQGYAKVRRWTKRIDIFAKDLLFVPINYAYHWTLGMIDMKKKIITIYDSMGGPHAPTLKLLIKYLAEEHQDKKKQPLDMSGWKTYDAKGIPLQQNMSDCGVFTCTFAERLSRYHELDFSQDDMDLIRKRMVLSIAKKEIL